MTLIIKIPVANPLRFYALNGSSFGYPAHENSWMAHYCQKFNQTDKLAIQVHLKEKYALGVTAILQDESENQIDTMTGTISSTFYQDDYRIWSMSDASVLDQEEGVYRVALSISVNDGEVISEKIYYSEWFYIAESHDDTVLLNYTNDVNDFDIDFDEGENSFDFRVEAGVMSEGFKPGSKDEVYIEQVRKVVKLESVPYNVESWVFGPPGRGIPNWMADKLNRILSCNQLTIDGQAYTKDDGGAKLEPVREADYPLAGWKIDMVKDDNYYSNNYSI